MEILSIYPSRNITVRAGRVFDGQGLIREKNADIVISGGLIREVRTFPEGAPPDPEEGVEVLDLLEFTVLPGLVDCHVHLALDGKDFNRSLELWARKDMLEERIKTNLAHTLSRGIVAVRDGGDRENIALAARDDPAMGNTPGPRILASGSALGRRGKYGTFLGPGLDGESIAGAVENLARRGVDQVKVLLSGVVSFKNYRRVGPIQFSEDELSGIVRSAHGLGIRVMAHASSDEAVRMAVRAGVDSLEHGYFVSEESLEAMAGAGIFWVPTLAPVANQLRGNLAGRYTPSEREVIIKTLRRQQKMVKKAMDAGVRIGVGSDAGATGVRHGQGFMDEILLLEEAGMGRGEILKAATGTGASVLGLEKEMGMVRPGMRPYLIAVRGNPLEDLSRLANLEYMILPSRG